MGPLNTCTASQKQTASPSNSRTTSSGVSYTVQIVSFCGILTMNVIRTTMQMKIVRNRVDEIRKAGEIVSTDGYASEVVPAGTDLLQNGAIAVIPRFLVTGKTDIPYNP